MIFPRLYRVRQNFDTTSIGDAAAEVRRLFADFDFAESIRPGQRVAVGVGSRGIHDLPTIVAALVDCLKEKGLEPYVIPAMGSHGGATGPGQAQVLAELGITESSVGAPIVASMETVRLGRLDSGAEIHLAADAMAADHLVVINRVKPHTAFRGEVESGLCKLMAVGLGRRKGASIMHRFGLSKTIIPAAEMILEKAPVLCGLAMVENAAGGIKTMELVRPEEFVATDVRLLEEAWQVLPRLPVDDLDILVVDEMGKDISGAGMDPNVIGFWRREGGSRQPDYRTVIVLDLTPKSHGNATGIGMADLTTQRLMDRLDLEATQTNALTSGILASARLPIALESDKAVLTAALGLVPDPAGVRLARIKNTKSLEKFWVSEAVLPELRSRPDVEVNERPAAIEFDAEGRLSMPDED